MPQVLQKKSSPANIDQLIATIQNQFPKAKIRVTGKARTIRRQAELMAQRIRVNRVEFMSTYRHRQHIKDMDKWYKANKTSSFKQTVDEFEKIITKARARGVLVSNHLSNTARDISWPFGTDIELDKIEQAINQLGASVIREPKAAGGRHWHVDW